MTTTIEKKIEYALEHGDHHTLTECAMIFKDHGNEEEGERLLRSAKRMKRAEYDEFFGYDEERDNEN